MQTETTKLIIHTGAGPDAAREEAKRGGPKKARASKVKAGEVVVWGLVQENEADGLGEKAKERTADAGRKARERSARRERTAALRRARIGKLLSPRRGEDSAAPCSGAARQAKSPMCLEGIAAVKDTDFSLPLAAESARESVSQRAKRSRGRFKSRRRSAKPRLTFGERLLRNSAIACALLLALLAARNIDTPWTRAAVEGVERALTMKINLDESLGSLSFVRDLMPESMLVFFDLSGKSELAQPVEGTLEKRFDEQQPWGGIRLRARRPRSWRRRRARVVATTQALRRRLGRDDRGMTTVWNPSAPICSSHRFMPESASSAGRASPAARRGGSILRFAARARSSIPRR